MSFDGIEIRPQHHSWGRVRSPYGYPEHMTGTVLMVRSPSRHVVVMTRPMGGPSVAMTYSPTDADALFLWAYVRSESSHM